MPQFLHKYAVMLCVCVAMQTLPWRTANGFAVVYPSSEPTVSGDLAPRGAPDGVLDAADLAVLQQILLEQIQPTDAEIRAADVAPQGTPDGVLNAADMIVLQQAVLRASMSSNPPDAPVLDVLPVLTNQATQTVSGSGPANLEIRIYLNDSLLGHTVAAADGRFSMVASLREGGNLLYGTSYNNGQQSVRSNMLHVSLDDIPPAITLTGLMDGAVTAIADQSIAGILSEPADITINGTPILVDSNLAFSYPISLSGDGQHQFVLVAEDDAGNVTTRDITVALDTVPPTPVDASAVTVTEQNGSSYAVSGPAGAAESGATVKLVNARTAGTATGVADSDGHFSIVVEGQGGDSVYLFQIDPAGNESNWAYAKLPGTAPLASVHFTQPLNGVVVDGDRILVEGTVAGPENLGVVVNGHVATVVRGQFFVNNLPLHAGGNVLTATVAAPNGEVASTSIVVTSAAHTPVYLAPDPSSGIPELTTKLSVVSSLARSIVKIEVDTNGDGIADFSTSDTADPISITSAQAGLHTLTAQTMDSAGSVYRTRLKIAVLEPLALDAQLRAVFQNFLNDLKAGNLSASMRHLNGPMKTKYQAMFEASANELPSLADNLGELRGGAVAGNLAQYMVVREEQGVQRGYPIFLIRDRDGIWRIGGM